MKEMLIEELKKNGLEIAEENAIMVAKVVFALLPKLIAQSTNKYDDMLLPVFALVEPKVIELLDNINKADNK